MGYGFVYKDSKTYSYHVFGPYAAAGLYRQNGQAFTILRLQLHHQPAVTLSYQKSIACYYEENIRQILEETIISESFHKLYYDSQRARRKEAIKCKNQ